MSFFCFYTSWIVWPSKKGKVGNNNPWKKKSLLATGTDAERSNATLKPIVFPSKAFRVLSSSQVFSNVLWSLWFCHHPGWWTPWWAHKIWRRVSFNSGNCSWIISPLLFSPFPQVLPSGPSVSGCNPSSYFLVCSATLHLCPVVPFTRFPHIYLPPPPKSFPSLLSYC